MSQCAGIIIVVDQRRHWAVTAEVQDVGSGDTTRPQRETLIAAARQREIDLVLVWRLDRWGRLLLDLVHTLQRLNALDVGFVSLCEALDAGPFHYWRSKGQGHGHREVEPSRLPVQDEAQCQRIGWCSPVRAMKQNHDCVFSRMECLEA